MVLLYATTLYAMMPAVTPAIYGTTDDSTNAQNAANLRQATLRIHGMTCPSCANAVEALLKQEEGMIRVNVDYSKRIARVVYDADKITIEEIMEVIQPYTATIAIDKGCECMAEKEESFLAPLIGLLLILCCVLPLLFIAGGATIFVGILSQQTVILIIGLLLIVLSGLIYGRRRS
ncbi:MAG: cation transporter [Candidatus Heimdallarchaeota archaeon]